MCVNALLKASFLWKIEKRARLVCTHVCTVSNTSLEDACERGVVRVKKCVLGYLPFAFLGASWSLAALAMVQLREFPLMQLLVMTAASMPSGNR